MQLSATVTGLAEIKRAFDAIEVKVRNQVLAAGTKAGAAVVLTAFKAAVAGQSDTGTSRKAAGVRHRKYKGGQVSMGIVGFRKGQARLVSRTFSKRGKQRIKLRKTKERRAPGRDVKDPFFFGHIPTQTGRKAVAAKQGGKRLPIRAKSGQLVMSRKARAVAPSGLIDRVAQQTAAPAQAAMLGAMRTALGLGQS